MMDLSLGSDNAPPVRAETAFRLFCSPADSRPENYDRLAERARFHLRHASCERFGDLQTYVLEPSSAPRGTTLLIHGWGAEASFLAAFAEPLRRAGSRVVLFDLPAHGLSGGRYTNLAGCAWAAHRIATLFGPINGIAGHSLGGLVSLWIAEGGPPLPTPIPPKRIALLACPNRFIDVTREFGAKLRLSAATQLEFERRLSRIGARPLESFSAANLLKRVACDVTLVHSLDDSEVKYANAQAIVATSPNVEFLPCQGLGHAKLLYDPTVIRTVVSFLVRD